MTKYDTIQMVLTHMDHLKSSCKGSDGDLEKMTELPDTCYASLLHT